MKVHRFGNAVGERVEDARKEEFASVFESERVGLQRLALLLTANSEAAKLCLIRTFRECISGCSVSKEWIPSWTRRVVIRNAISLVMIPRDESFVNTNDDAIAFSQDDMLSAIAQFEPILGLPAFDRLVFVICVLERYSMYDCALLLRRPPRDVNEARERVGNQVGQISALRDSSVRFRLASGANRSGGENEYHFLQSK
jgi:hypothetical protein